MKRKKHVKKEYSSEPKGTSVYGLKHQSQQRGVFNESSPLPAYKKRTVLIGCTGKNTIVKVAQRQ